MVELEPPLFPSLLKEAHKDGVMSRGSQGSSPAVVCLPLVEGGLIAQPLASSTSEHIMGSLIHQTKN